MTFKEGLKYTNITPYIIVEIDQFATYTGFTILEPGIWRINLTLVEGVDGTGLFVPFADDTYNKEILNVNSLRVTFDGLTSSYERVDSYTDLRTQTNRFSYDISTGTLYIAFDDWNPAGIYSTEIGVSLSYIYTTNPNGYTDEYGIYYDPRVVSVSPITETKDRLFYGTQQLNAMNVTLLNDLGDLDFLATSTIYGNPARVEMGFSIDDNDPPLSTEFETMYTGRVDTIPKAGLENLSISIRDERAFMTDPIPTAIYNSTDYPDIDDDLAGQKIQLVFGDCRSVPIQIVNKEGTEPWICKICDTDFNGFTHYDIKEITQVYVDGVAVTETNPSLVDATFELSTVQVKNGDNFLTVTADIQGYAISGTLIDNPLEITEILIRAYRGLSFLDSNYNLPNWNSTKTKAKDVSIVISDSNLQMITELFSTSIQAMFKTDRDGRFNWIISTDDAGITKSILQEEFLEDPEIEPRVDQVVSVTSAEYNEKWDTNTARRVENTTYKDEVFTNYRVRKEAKYKTVLKNKADAEAVILTSILRNKQVQPEYTATTAHQNFDIQLGDNINMEVNRIDKPIVGNMKGEVESISLNLQELKTTIGVRYIETVPEETTEYKQGFIYNDKIFNDKIYGDTGRD